MNNNQTQQPNSLRNSSPLELAENQSSTEANQRVSTVDSSVNLYLSSIFLFSLERQIRFPAKKLREL